LSSAKIYISKIKSMLRSFTYSVNWRVSYVIS